MIYNWLNKRGLEKKLKDCNFNMAKELVAQKFSGGSSKDQLVALLDGFYKQPSLETGVALLQFAPDLIPFFESARHGRITEFLFRRGDLK